MMIEKCIINKVKIPTSIDKVYKDECSFSFDNSISENGLYICLNKFLAFGHKFVSLYSQKTGNKIFLNIKTIIHEIDSDGEPQTKKPSKLAIGIEGGFTDQAKYKHEDIFNIFILPQFTLIPINDPNLPEIVKKSVAGIIEANSAAKQMEIDSLQNTWDGEQRIVSKFAENLMQLDNGKKIKPGGWQCEKCDLVDNLWMNLTDGTILCGRKFFDGSGGNNHANEYYNETGFPLAVKLGTINPTSADVYSYAEDDMVEDPYLAQHLAHFGIDIMKLEKTEKTMIEIELELNQRAWEWRAIEESGSELRTLYGPNHTGIHNLGNTCYINSVLQIFMSTPVFIQYYLKTPAEMVEKAPDNPYIDFNTQMRKCAYGLASGDYSKEQLNNKKTTNGIHPTYLKNIIGQGHFEFSTNKQQDAAEYLQHLFTFIERNSVGEIMTPIDAFRFEMEDRLECNSSHQVKYLTHIENILSFPIPLDQIYNKDELAAYELKKLESERNGIKLNESESVRSNLSFDCCINSYLNSTQLDDFYSSAINSKTTATKSVRLRTFPNYLFIQLQKFAIGSDWVERKLDVSVDMPLELDLSCMRGKGQQLNEVLLPQALDHNQENMEVEEPIDENILNNLLLMGFGCEGCKRALVNTKGQGVEAAVNWIMEHMTDPDFNDPLPKKSTGNIDPASLESIISMGFSKQHAIAALRATDNNVERAMDWIFSHPADESCETTQQSNVNPISKLTDGSTKYKLTAFISHIGTSTKCGHYVCHVRKGEGWVIYNDEKVAQSINPPKDLAFIYLYTRN